MNEIINHRLGKAGLTLALAVFCCPPASADAVYKCVAGGKTNFTSKPAEAAGDCQPLELHVPEPNPVDMTRQSEANHRYAQERDAEARRRRKEPDADAQRRAESARIAESVAKSPLPASPWGGRSGSGRRKGQ